MNQTLPKGGGMLILSVKSMKDVAASGLFIDLKLVCAIQIEYQVEFIFFFRAIQIKESKRNIKYNKKNCD